jgi:hypothetical protein
MCDVFSISCLLVIDSAIAYLALLFLLVCCVFTISINDNRLDEMRHLEKEIQRNASEIANLGSTVAFSGANDQAKSFNALVEASHELRGKFSGLMYKRFYGDHDVANKLRKGPDANTEGARDVGKKTMAMSTRRWMSRPWSGLA